MYGVFDSFLRAVRNAKRLQLKTYNQNSVMNNQSLRPYDLN